MIIFMIVFSVNYKEFKIKIDLLRVFSEFTLTLMSASKNILSSMTFPRYVLSNFIYWSRSDHAPGCVRSLQIT